MISDIPPIDLRLTLIKDFRERSEKPFILRLEKEFSAKKTNLARLHQVNSQRISIEMISSDC